MSADAVYVCPVCGHPGLDEAPRPPLGGGSDEICPSCGFEFGFTDEACGYSYSAWREEWIARGMPWDSEGIRNPPEGWDPARQLQNVVGPEERAGPDVGGPGFKYGPESGDLA